MHFLFFLVNFAKMNKHQTTMNKRLFLRGGEIPYLKPELEITNIEAESGFLASLPMIDTEEGDPWEDFDDGGYY